jgi:hypothetical protein
MSLKSRCASTTVSSILNMLCIRPQFPLSPCALRWQTGGLERALAERNADQTARDTRRFGVSSKGCRPKEQTAVADTYAPQKQTKKKSDKEDRLVGLKKRVFREKENLSSTAPEAQEALLEKL